MGMVVEREEAGVIRQERHVPQIRCDNDSPAFRLLFQLVKNFDDAKSIEPDASTLPT
jgi:hypothetical protein